VSCSVACCVVACDSSLTLLYDEDDRGHCGWPEEAADRRRQGVPRLLMRPSQSFLLKELTRQPRFVRLALFDINTP
jgi:hypothetical protein